MSDDKKKITNNTANINKMVYHELLAPLKIIKYNFSINGKRTLNELLFTVH